MTVTQTYPDYPASALELEEEVLGRWKTEDLFRSALAATDGAEEFVFFEGPPTANGRPGIHHVISRAIKDAVCRHRAIRGNVERFQVAFVACESRDLVRLLPTKPQPN